MAASPALYRALEAGSRSYENWFLAERWPLRKGRHAEYGSARFPEQKEGTFGGKTFDFANSERG